VLEICCRVFPRCICGLKSLRKLSVSCNNLTSLPPALSSVTTLEFLDISFNKIRALPATLARLCQLQALNGAFNPLGSQVVANEADTLKNERATKAPAVKFEQHEGSLGESEVQAGDLPAVIFEMCSLKQLNLDHTGCCVIDERFGALTSLEALQV
jgi:Leucine-rich repeat (LRR) protein